MPNSTRAERSKAFVEAYRKNENVEVIPSRQDIKGDEEEEKEELVGAYCRVSTMNEAQVESYELQKAYYEDMVERRPNWRLVDIYPDEGISATSMRNRKNFLRMIEDCKQGKLTLIVTKSVSRFARNVVDGISVVRMLRNLNPPVAVYFETEHIITTAAGADAQLSLLASFAESESLTKSVSMKWAIRNRFARGIPKLTDLYGFERHGHMLYPCDDDRCIEGSVVQWMYYAFLRGKSIPEIIERLHRHRIPSPKGKERWSYSSVLYVLTNEKYAGNVLMQKTVRADMFLHKSVKNTGQERQYRVLAYHQCIIPMDVWEDVQTKLDRSNIQHYITDVSIELTYEPSKRYFAIQGIKSSEKK